MHVYVLFHGDYEQSRPIAASTTRDALDQWVAEYESTVPDYAREAAHVAAVALDEIPPVVDFRPAWATESDDEHRARLAAEAAANPGAYFSTGSVGFIPAVVI